ncbi:SDR family oxidoreductase [Terribacillus sp. DMT04]|uniref:SDR family oxidoreductase n=1 Tax=Terribacillus sp. DMT04 TaxID=2850441 RepID=UPI001C2BB1F4|nr:SDR family oxidoreductase [Terribacillus sp. DMT04]QXE02090.1 SDR family oxidoreductase [Terribacillus sp. DMT04]
MQKTVVITGANAGMGFAATVALARKGHTVCMLCRSEERGQHALEQAKQQSGSADIHLYACDLASFSSIHTCAEVLKSNHPVIDVLLNNAGVVTTKKQYTEDGLEMMMGVNHLGHFLLTNLLLEPIKAASQGRIIVLSSGAYKIGKISLDEVGESASFTPWQNYGHSKLANLLFTKELSLRLHHSNATVNAVHPGAVSTSLGVDRQTGFGRRVHQLLRPFFQTPAEGADTALYLAESPEVKYVSGGYFYKRRIQEVKGQADDAELAKKFWAISERKVGLTV